MNTKLLGIAVVIVAVIGAIGFLPKEQVATPVGALSSPDIQSPYLSVSGVRHEYRRAYMSTTATTTPCSIAAPVGTSTLLSYSYQIFTATGTAAVIDVATSSIAFATSTNMNLIHQRAVASGAQDTMFWTSTSTLAGGASLIVLNSSVATSSYVVLKTGNTVGGFGYQFGGVCQAEFLVIGS